MRFLWTDGRGGRHHAGVVGGVEAYYSPLLARTTHYAVEVCTPGGWAYYMLDGTPLRQQAPLACYPAREVPLAIVIALCQAWPGASAAVLATCCPRH